MVRIAGTNIPDKERIEIALTYIYGIGRSLSNLILDSVKINKNKRAKDLTAEEINKIQALIEGNYRVEGELRREITENIRRLKEIGCWRGMRHGRTRTNSRTLRGNVRRTMGSGRRPPPSPT